MQKCESISKDGRLTGMHEEKIGVIDSSKLQIEKHRHSDILNISNSAAQGRKEQKNQCKSPTLKLLITNLCLIFLQAKLYDWCSFA